MSEYHPPRLRGSCTFIELLEKEIKRIHGVVIWRDGGKRSETDIFESQKNYRSPTFQRTYYVPVGYEGIRNLTVRVKVFYDYRDGSATLEASHAEKFEQLFKRQPALQKAIQEALTHSNGHKMVDIKMLTEDRAEIIFTCPRCKENIPHECEGSKK